MSSTPDEKLAWAHALCARFGRVERGGRDQHGASYFKATCLAHEDRHPSVSVAARDRRLTAFCFAGCSEDAVLASWGLTVQDLFYEPARGRCEREVRVSIPASHPARPATKLRPPRRSFPGFKVTRLGEPAATYDYVDEAGEVRYVIGRFLDADGGKTFRQFTPDPRRPGHWFRVGPIEDQKILYRLPELAAAVSDGRTVCVVEGEKDADAGAGAQLDGSGWVFTSAPGGAKAPWLEQYTAALAGAARVVIVADRDEVGRRYAEEVATSVSAAGVADVRIVQAREGKDLADHLVAGWTLPDLDPVTEPTPEPAGEEPPPSGPPAGPSSTDDDGGDGPRMPRRYATGPRYEVAKGQLWRVTIEKRTDERAARELFTPVLGADVRLTRQFIAVTGDEAQDLEAASAPSRVELAVSYPGEAGEAGKDGQGAYDDVHTFDLKRWRSGDWLDSLRPTAYFDPSKNGRNAAIAAVRAVSTSAALVPQHVATGWRVIDGERCYVHAGGAITAAGTRELNVDLPPQLARYRLPDPPTDPAVMAAAAEHSTNMVGLDWLPDRLGFGLLGIVYRSILPAANMVGLLTEVAGAGKSSLTIPAVQHFAPSLTYRAKGTTSMAELGASPKAVQRITHAAADAVLVVDDFPPQTRGAAASTATQAAFIRAVYDRSARDTLTMDRRLVAGPAARGAVLTAAEYAPVDTGARDRALLMPMPGWGTTPPVKQLQWLERPAAAAGRGQFMAALIRHVAGIEVAALESWTNERDQTNAVALVEAGYSTRTAEHVGKALTGWDMALQLIGTAGAWPQERIEQLRARVWAAAVDAAEAATDRDADPSAAHRLVRLLRESLGSSAHVADRYRPDTWPMGMDPLAAGWTALPAPAGEDDPLHAARGDRIGWVDGDRLWLHPGRALRVAIAAAEAEGIHLQALTDRSAGDLLRAAGWLQADQGRNTIQRRVSGRPERVWSLPASLFWPEDETGADDESPLPQMPPTPDDQLPDAYPTPETGSPATSPVEPAPSDTSSVPPRTVCASCDLPMVQIEPGQTTHPACHPQNTPPTAPRAAQEPAQPSQVQSPQDEARNGHRPAQARTEPRFRAAEVVVACDGVHWPDGSVSELPGPVDQLDAGQLAVWADSAGVGRGGGRDLPEPGHLYLAQDLAAALNLPTGDPDPAKLGRQLRAARRKPFWAQAIADGFEFSSSDRPDGGWIRLWRKRAPGIAAGSVVITSPAWIHTFALFDGDPEPLRPRPRWTEPRWLPAETPVGYLRRLTAYQSAMGSPLVINEGVTAANMMRLPAVELPVLPWPQMAADFSWHRPASKDERRLGWVHAYDRRASYLPGIGSVQVGGDLVYEVAPVVDPRRSGFWRVTAAAGWDACGFLLPDVFASDGGEPTQWVPSVVLGLLAEEGPVEVAEAWLYSAPSRALDKTYERIRDGLRRVRGTDPAVEAAVKVSYTAGIGMLDKVEHRAKKAGEPDPARSGHHPDVRAQIIATHRANSYRAMIYAGASGIWPLAMARRDAVLFASDDADPIAAWPGRPQDLDPAKNGKNGKYKPAGSMPMDRWLAASESRSAAGVVSLVTDYVPEELSDDAS